MSIIQRLDRERGVRLLKAIFLLTIARKPYGEMAQSDIDDLWLGYDVDLIPELDREVALEELLKEGLVELVEEGFVTSRAVNDRFVITDAGLAEIKLRGRDKRTLIYKCGHFGSEWAKSKLEEVYGYLLDSRLQPLPGSPLAEIDFAANHAAQRQVLTKLDELIVAVKANNAFRQGDAEAHASVVGSLQQLSEEVKGGRTTIGRLEAIAFGALSFVAAKFAETIIGILATDVWALITAVVKAIM